MDVPLSSDTLDLSFHPGEGTHLLAAGLISGKIQLVNYDALAQSSASAPASEGSKLYRKLWNTRPSSKSCRGVSFTQDGASIASISKDKSLFLVDTETGKIRTAWTDAHDAAPSRVLPIDPNLLATGDDDGVVSLWDPRKTGKVRSYEHHFDWITDLLWCQHLEPPKEKEKNKEDTEKRDKKRRKKMQRDEDSDEEKDAPAVPATGRSRLVCTSGDGSLSTIDIRMGGKNAAEVSEDQEDELLSIAPVKNGSKLVVGTQLGMLSLWAPSRGLLDHVDRIPGHPSSVDALVTLDEDTVLTGSSDGLVRVVQILPHKLLGVIADHNGLPVERMKRHGRWVGSLGHGNEIKITDVGPLLDGDSDDDDDDDAQATPFGVIVPDADDSDDDSSQDEEMDDEDVQGAPGQDEDDDDEDDDDDDDDSDLDSDDESAPKQTPAWDVGPSSRAAAQRADFFADL